MNLLNQPISSLVKEISEVAQYLWQKGWAERNAGNISIRVTEMMKNDHPAADSFREFTLPMLFRDLAGECFLTTGAGRRMRDVSSDPEKNCLLIRITEKGETFQILSPSREVLKDLRPTSELSSHLSIHQYLKRHKPGKKALVHTHPNEIISLTHLPEGKGNENLTNLIWSMHPEAALFLPDGMGFVPYLLTGSNELALATLEILKKKDVVVWEKHGCLAVAGTVSEAFDLIDMVSKSADIYLRCRATGVVPEGLTVEQLRELKEKVGIHSKNLTADL